MNTIKYKKGYLFVEVMIALGIFSVIVTMALGAVINILNTNERVRGSKDALNSLNLAIEDMTRTIAFGKNYHCGSGTPYTTITDCTTTSALNNFLALRNNAGQIVIYRLGTGANAGKIEYSPNGGATYQPMSSGNVYIESLRFYVTGANNTTVGNNIIQPHVRILIRGYSGDNPTNRANFDLQTTVSQREIDIP